MTSGFSKKITSAEAVDLLGGFALLFWLGGPYWFFIALATVFAMEANNNGADFGARKIRV